MKDRNIAQEFIRDKELSEPEEVIPERRSDGTFLPGHTGNPGGRLHADKRNFFLNALREAFDKTGGVDKLVRWAKKNPSKFYAICGKMIPIEWVIEREGIGSEVVIRHAIPTHRLGTGAAIVISSPDNLTKEDILRALKKLDRADIQGILDSLNDNDELTNAQRDYDAKRHG